MSLNGDPKVKNTDGELNNLRYTKNLVAFIECLEKSVCNAIDGTATALPTAQKVSVSSILISILSKYYIEL